MRILSVAAFALAISVTMVTAIPMKKEENTEVDRSGPSRSDVPTMADQAIDIRRDYSCVPKDGECTTIFDCCGSLVCYSYANSWEGRICGEESKHCSCL